MASSNVGVAPQTVLSAVSTGTGSFDFDVAHTTHSMVVTSGAGVSAGVVNLELSHDGTNWYAPGSNTVSTTAANTVYGVTVTFPARFVRARVSTSITGGTVTASVASA